MNRPLHLGLTWLLSLATMPALGAYKCIDEHGRILYQAMPCPADTQGGDINLNVNRPFSGHVSAPAAEQPTPIITPLSTEPADHAIPVTPLDQPPPPVHRLLE